MPAAPSQADKALSHGKSLESLVSECEPEIDDIDKRILFEMTGIKLDQADYRDESSDEEREGSEGGRDGDGPIILETDHFEDESTYSMIN